MQDLIAQVAANVGLEPAQAEKAIAMILAFLQKNGPTDAVGRMMQAMPGAQDLAASQAEGGGGMLGGLMNMMGAGNSVMALGQQLMGEGIGMGQIGSLAKEVFGYAQGKAGEDTMGEIVGAIPGLAQFI